MNYIIFGFDISTYMPQFLDSCDSTKWKKLQGLLRLGSHRTFRSAALTAFLGLSRRSCRRLRGPKNSLAEFTWWMRIPQMDTNGWFMMFMVWCFMTFHGLTMLDVSWFEVTEKAKAPDNRTPKNPISDFAWSTCLQALSDLLSNLQLRTLISLWDGCIQTETHCISFYQGKFEPTQACSMPEIWAGSTIAPSTWRRHDRFTHRNAQCRKPSNICYNML